MGHPKFSQEDFLGAALAIVAERGVTGVTVASVSERLGSPTGSFYHRFASRDVLLGSLWLRTVLDFQTGISAALDADDALKAALHTPAWVRKHPDKACLLLLHDRKDFLKAEWSPELREGVTEMTQRMEVGSRKWARVIFGKEGRDEVRLAQFLISFQITGTSDPLMQFQARMRFLAFTGQFVQREYDPLAFPVAAAG